MSKFNINKYATLRKKLLREKQQLIYDRTETNKKIRKVDSEMSAWDKALLNN